MNILAFSDVHIIEKDLPEIEAVFGELLILKDKYCINKIIMAGDTFDKVNPTPKELDCFAKFVKKVNIPIILITAKSHESISVGENVLTHFGILKSNMSVNSEYKDENKLFVGHFIVKQSSKNFGGTVDKMELKKYEHVLLGHGHNFEIVKPNVCQMGSIRFIDFGEDPNISKKIVLCENYKEEGEKWHFLQLNSPFPMKNLILGDNLMQGNELHINKEIEANTEADSAIKVPQKPDLEGFEGEFKDISSLCAYLDKLEQNTKVRIIFNDYNLWRQFLPNYDTYKSKFVTFRDRKDFLISELAPISTKSETQPFKESLTKFMEDNKIEQKIKDILLEEIK